MPHKNASSQNGFVFKNNTHMVSWHLNMGIWIAVDARLQPNYTDPGYFTLAAINLKL